MKVEKKEEKESVKGRQLKVRMNDEFGWLSFFQEVIHYCCCFFDPILPFVPLLLLLLILLLFLLDEGKDLMEWRSI